MSSAQKAWVAYLATQSIWIFFFIYFTPKQLQEPVAVWGVTSMVDPGNPWDILKPLLVRDDGPRFLESPTVSEWRSVSPPPEKVEWMLYRARPVVTLSDAKVVEEVVVTPLIERLSSQP
jgi:hypothetical protein